MCQEIIKGLHLVLKPWAAKRGYMGPQNPQTGSIWYSSASCVPAKNFTCSKPAPSDRYKVSAERFNGGFYSRGGGGGQGSPHGAEDVS